MRDIDVDKYPECAWFARNLSRIRQQRNLTQKEFAAVLGLSPAYLSALEGAKTNPTLEILSTIAKATDFSVAQLVSRRAPKVNDDKAQS